MRGRSFLLQRDTPHVTWAFTPLQIMTPSLTDAWSSPPLSVFTLISATTLGAPVPWGPALHTFASRILGLSLFFFWPRSPACGILVPWPGIKPVPPAVEAQSPNQWTASEVPWVSALEDPCQLSTHIHGHPLELSPQLLLRVWNVQLSFILTSDHNLSVLTIASSDYVLSPYSLLPVKHLFLNGLDAVIYHVSTLFSNPSPPLTHTTKPQPPLRPSLFPHRSADDAEGSSPASLRGAASGLWCPTSLGSRRALVVILLNMSLSSSHKHSLKPCPFPSDSFLTSLFSILSRRSSPEKWKAGGKTSPTSNTPQAIYIQPPVIFYWQWKRPSHPSSASSFPSWNKSIHQLSSAFGLSPPRLPWVPHTSYNLLCLTPSFHGKVPRKSISIPHFAFLTCQSIPDPLFLFLNWNGSFQGCLASPLLNPTAMAITSP